MKYFVDFFDKGSIKSLEVEASNRKEAKIKVKKAISGKEIVGIKLPEKN